MSTYITQLRWISIFVGNLLGHLIKMQYLNKVKHNLVLSHIYTCYFPFVQSSTYSVHSLWKLYIVIKTEEKTNARECKLCAFSSAVLTWIRASTLSWTMVGGLFLGEIILTSTPSTKSLLVTKAWKRWPQFFTHVSRTWQMHRRHHWNSSSYREVQKFWSQDTKWT